MSRAPSVSAQASASDRKIVFRAGTYVMGIPSPISAAERSFGTAMSAVRAEPPKALRSMLVTTWWATPIARATRRAASISPACRCP